VNVSKQSQGYRRAESSNMGLNWGACTPSYLCQPHLLQVNHLLAYSRTGEWSPKKSWLLRSRPNEMGGIRRPRAKQRPATRKASQNFLLIRNWGCCQMRPCS
jgi:hypothetical protein